MTNYVTIDGRKFTARSPAELVEKLRKESFVRADSDEAFMTETAERARIQKENAQISTESKKDFVDSLVRYGLLTVLDNQE